MSALDPIFMSGVRGRAGRAAANRPHHNHQAHESKDRNGND